MSLLFCLGTDDPSGMLAALHCLPEQLRASMRSLHEIGDRSSRLVAGHAVDTWSDGDCAVLLTGTARDSNHSAGDTRRRARDISREWRARGDAALADLHGEFALVIVDHATADVHLYVDPFGLESLFARTVGGGIAVCSEVMPLLHFGSRPPLDLLALQDVFALRILTGRRTLWDGIRQVLPGVRVTVRADGSMLEQEVRRVRFEPRHHDLTRDAAVDEIDARLHQAFGRRRDEGVRCAAVPLSGGVDSAIMAAYAARYFPRVIAFTASIEGYDNPELGRAQDVASALGMEHRIVSVSGSDVVRLYPVLIDRLQEPPRHHNSLVVARLVEAMSLDCDCVVAGDTADTLAGNSVLTTTENFARKRAAIERLPSSLVSIARSVSAALPGDRPARLSRLLGTDLHALIRVPDLLPRGPGTRALLAEIATEEGPSAELVATHFEAQHAPYEAFQTWHVRTLMRASYRRNGRLGRAAGLDFWYPLKERAVTDVLFGLPYRLKHDWTKHETKPVLRDLCDRVVGPGVSQWSKLGFPSPERAWMEGPLVDVMNASRRRDAHVAKIFGHEAVQAIDIATEHQTLWTLMTLESVLADASGR